MSRTLASRIGITLLAVAAIGVVVCNLALSRNGPMPSWLSVVLGCAVLAAGWGAWLILLTRWTLVRRIAFWYLVAVTPFIVAITVGIASIQGQGR